MKKSNKTWSFLLFCLGVFTNYTFGQTYCSATSTTCENEIENVSFTGESTGINNSSACTAGGYADYTSQIAYVMPGSTYTGTTTSNPQGYFQGTLAIWIDWNQNGDFTDAGESITSQNTFQAGGGVPLAFTVNVPAGAVLGTTRMRIRTHNSVNAVPSCGVVTTGETEDYTIIVTDQPIVATSYCAANGGCDGGPQDRHIENVTYDVVDKSSTCGTGSYSDFTSEIGDVAIGGAVTVTMLTSAFNQFDLATAFIDWNNDFDFDDLGETFNMAGNAGLYTVSISPPNNTTTGPKRMRLAFTSGGQGVYSGCGPTSIGEIEDYTLNVTAPAPNCIINNAPADASTGVCRDAILTWNRDLLGSQPEGYKVYFGTTTATTLVSDQDTTSYNPGTLLPNTTYYYSIVAYNSTGDATGCDTFSFTTTDLAAAITPNPAGVCTGAVLTLAGNPSGSGDNFASQDWTGPGAANLSSTTTDSTDFTSNLVGDYDLIYTVTDNNGCVASDNVTVQVQDPSVVDVSIAITSGTNPTCSGIDVEFTATGSNEGLTPVYTWRINGTDVANGSIFTSSTLSDADVVDVVLNSSLSCIDNPAKVSNSITMNVTPSVNPTADIVSAVNPYCTGEVLNLTANVAHEGTSPIYDWTVNGVSVSNTANYSQLFQDNDTVVFTMTSDAVCAIPATVTDTFIVLYTTYETPSVHVLITQGVNPTCAGDSIEFTAVPAFGGTNPTYEWFVNGNPVASSDIHASDFADGDLISVTLTSDYACLTQATASSGDSLITVNAVVTPEVTVLPSSSPYCTGDMLTLNANVANEGSNPTYEWRVNGTAVGTNSTYSQIFQDGDKVVCELTSDVSCATQSSVLSDTFLVMHSAYETPIVDILITGGSNPGCEGSDLEFTASPTFGGSNPTYEWFVNGNSMATGSTYLSAAFVDGDVISVTLTSDYACLNQPTGDSGDSLIARTANETPMVDATIIAGNDTICEGSLVSFGTTEIFTGSNPSYDWTVNGNSVSSDSVYTTTTLADGDVVQVVIASDYACVTDTNAMSQTISMVVNAVPSQPTISVDVDILTSSADFNNQWQFNGADISGAVNKTYQFTQNGSYTVYVVENGCGSDTSNAFVVTNAGLEEVDMYQSLKVYPNPTNGKFILEMDVVEAQNGVITDLNGKVISSFDLNGKSNSIDISSLEAGVYLVKVNTPQRSLVARIVKN